MGSSNGTDKGIAFSVPQTVENGPGPSLAKRAVQESIRLPKDFGALIQAVQQYPTSAPLNEVFSYSLTGFLQVVLESASSRT